MRVRFTRDVAPNWVGRFNAKKRKNGAKDAKDFWGNVWVVEATIA